MDFKTIISVCKFGTITIKEANDLINEQIERFIEKAKEEIDIVDAMADKGSQKDNMIKLLYKLQQSFTQ